MGGCHGTDALLLQIVQDRDCQCGTFRRVGTRSQLIEENEGFRISLFDKGNHVGHMGGEGTERLLDTLLVSDIRIDFLKNRQFGTVKCRNVKTCLSHQGKKTDRF